MRLFPGSHFNMMRNALPGVTHSNHTTISLSPIKGSWITVDLWGFFAIVFEKHIVFFEKDQFSPR